MQKRAEQKMAVKKSSLYCVYVCVCSWIGMTFQDETACSFGIRTKLQPCSSNGRIGMT